MKRPMTLSTILLTNFLTRLLTRLRDSFTAITPLPKTTAVGSDNDKQILQHEIKIFNKQADFSRRTAETL